MNLQYRDMTEDDLEQVLQIEKQNFPDPWGEKVFIVAMNAVTCRNTVVYDESGPVKVLGYTILSIAHGESHLLKMSISEQNQLQSIGTMFMDYLFTLTDVKGSEFTKMWLELRKSNEAAMKLYTKFGFTTHIERKDYYEHTDDDGNVVHEDAIMMVREV